MGGVLVNRWSRAALQYAALAPQAKMCAMSSLFPRLHVHKSFSLRQTRSCSHTQASFLRQNRLKGCLRELWGRGVPGVRPSIDGFGQQIADAAVDLVTIRLGQAEHREMRPEAIDNAKFAVGDELLLGFAVGRWKEHVA